ncbi:hypothetical protein [Haladaptatus sp. DFWS20]|uniref:hypothetical protein n=1 Tax=Haladaptatus sp. DFWS20 TaxID=3403467 RepID=UPI003EBE5C86
MAQQYQQPTGQTGQQYQQPMRQQHQGGQQPQIGQQPIGQMGQEQVGTREMQFEDSLPGELRIALDDFTKVEKTAEWAIDKCLDLGPQVAPVVRELEDVAELAELNVKLIARDSVHGPKVARTFVEVGQECLQKIRQYQQPYLQQVSMNIQKAIESTQKMLSTLGQGQQMGQQGVPQQGVGLSGIGQQLPTGTQQTGSQAQQFGSR